MYDPEKISAEIAGSLTPQLEGAPRTTAHSSRSDPFPSPKPDCKGGDSHS